MSQLKGIQICFFAFYSCKKGSRLSVIHVQIPFILFQRFDLFVLVGKKMSEKKGPSSEVENSVGLWLKWDQCQSTRKEIEQLKVF